MKAKKYWILRAMIVPTLLLAGCDREGPEDTAQSAEDAAQSAEDAAQSAEDAAQSAEDTAQSAASEKVKEEVKQLCSLCNAVTDWYENLNLKDKLFEPLYTVQVQNVFLNQNKRPYLFFVDIADIKKIKEKYILIADQRCPIRSRQNIFIHLRLFCDGETVERIFERRPSRSDRYALIATIKSIVKPDLVIEPDIEHELLDEDNTFAETHPDDIYDFLDLKINCENYNSFIATGKCEGLVFVGKDDWMEDPSEYERFLEIFDINKDKEPKNRGGKIISTEEMMKEAQDNK